MHNRSRKAPFLATVATALAGLAGCANDTNRIVPNTDVLPFANSVSAQFTGSNQTTAGSASISHRQPIPLSEDRSFGALASLEAQVSAGSTDHAEAKDLSVTQFDGKIALGLYGVRSNGTFIAVTPYFRAGHVTTDSVTDKRIVLSPGAEALFQTTLGGSRNNLRVLVGGGYADESTNYSQNGLSFDGNGNGYDVRAQALYDVWVREHTDAQTKKTSIDHKIALALGASFAEVSRDITGNVGNTPVQINEDERRASVNFGVLYANDRFYLLPGVRASFIDVARSGNTSDKGDSMSIVGPFLQGGINLRRIAAELFSDKPEEQQNSALYLRGELFYNLNNRKDDELGATIGLSFNY